MGGGYVPLQSLFDTPLAVSCPCWSHMQVNDLLNQVKATPVSLTEVTKGI